jgi:hypothetical protein
MDDAALVSRFQSLRDLPRDVDCVIRRDRAALQPVLYGFTIDKLQNKAWRTACLFVSINLCNVGMIERSQNLSLTLRARGVQGRATIRQARP